MSSPALVEIDRRADGERPHRSDWYEIEAVSASIEEVASSRPTTRGAEERWQRLDNSDDRAEFDRVADELAYGTVGLGSLRAATQHPAYGEILAMGRGAVPFLLGRVDDPTQGPLWMRLLGSLIGFPPMLKMDTVADAAEAWRIWGRSLGFLAR